jgi:tetraacyldisaccharide 4'-kinase
VILTRAEQADESRRAEIRRRVAQYAPQAAWVEATHAPVGLLWRAGRDEPLETLRDKSIAAFCGIGNPAGFWHALESCGYRVAARRTFADHHAFSDADLVDLARWSDPLEVAAVVCTQKDLVKVAAGWRGEKPLFALNSQLQILNGQAELERALDKVLPHPG